MGPSRMAVVVFAAGVLAAGLAWDVGFIADDLAIVQVVAQGPGDSGLFDEALPPEVWGILRPVGFWDFHLETRLAGFDDHALRISQQLLHGSNAALVLASGRLLGLGVAPAGAAAVLFAVHPANGQVLAFLGCRFDQLALAFSLACVLFFHGSLKRAWRGALVMSFLAYVLALGSKESAAPLPAILLIVLGVSARSLLAVLPFVVWTALWFAARAWLVGANAARPGIPVVPGLSQLADGLLAAMDLVSPVDVSSFNVSVLILAVVSTTAVVALRRGRWTDGGGPACSWTGSAAASLAAGLLWILPVTPLLARQAGLEDARLVHGALPWFLLAAAAIAAGLLRGPGAMRRRDGVSDGVPAMNSFVRLVREREVAHRIIVAASGPLIVLSTLALEKCISRWGDNARDCQHLVGIAHELGRRAPGAFLSLDPVPLMRDRAWMYAGGFQLISDGFAVARGRRTVPAFEAGADLSPWMTRLSALETIDYVLLPHDRGVLRGQGADFLDTTRLSSRAGSSWSWLDVSPVEPLDADPGTRSASLVPTFRPGVLETGELHRDVRAGTIIEVELSLHHAPRIESREPGEVSREPRPPETTPGPLSIRPPAPLPSESRAFSESSGLDRGPSRKPPASLAPCRLRWKSRLVVFSDLFSIPFAVVADGRTRRYRLHLPPSASWAALEESLICVAGPGPADRQPDILRGLQLELPVTTPVEDLRVHIVTGAP